LPCANIYADTNFMDVMKAKYANLAGQLGYQKRPKSSPVLATWDAFLLRCRNVRSARELDKTVQRSDSVIRLSAFDGVGSVELLKEDHEGQLMLHRHGRERPYFVALIAERRRVAVGASDEKRHVLYSGAVFQPGQPFTDLKSSQLRSSFIESDSVAPLAPGEKCG